MDPPMRDGPKPANPNPFPELQSALFLLDPTKATTPGSSAFSLFPELLTIPPSCAWFESVAAARDEALRVPLLAACLKLSSALLCSAAPSQAQQVHRHTKKIPLAPRPRYLHGLCDCKFDLLVAGTQIGAVILIFQGFHRADWSFRAAGSDVVSVKCKADRVDSGYVLNGNKMWSTNGPVAQTLVVYAKTDITAGSKGITAFIIKKGMPGFSTAQKLDKLGMRGSDTCELAFENCFVSEENVLWEVGKGVYVMMSGLVLERLGLAAGPLGIMQACLDVVLPYVGQREQFGHPIGEFQFIQIDLVTGESCRHVYFIVLKLAWQQDNIFHFRAYVYSVARDCNNEKVDAKVHFDIVLYQHMSVVARVKCNTIMLSR
ncbi:hypothetical protein S83_011926 [Arachis hypogaea]